MGLIMTLNYFVFDKALYYCEPTTFQIFDKDYELKHNFPNAAIVYSTMNKALQEMKRLNHKNKDY